MLAPALAVAALTLTATAASAIMGQPKPNLTVEAQRSPEGARLIVKGKNWPANARIKLTATRAPGASQGQDFGMVDTDSAGVLNVRKVALCSTNNADETQINPVTFTAADSATGVKVTSNVLGGAWLCQ